MINVLLVEDHTIVRDGIRMILEASGEIKIVGEANNGKDVLDILKTQDNVDILLTDKNIPEIDGIGLIKHAKTLQPSIAVVLLSMFDEEQYLFQAFAEGADGYILKNARAEELIFGLKFIHNGGRYVCADFTVKIIEGILSDKHYGARYNKSELDFTQREIEVLNLIAEGMTNKEIAEKLFISQRTVEGHRQILTDKTNSKNTAALIRFAVLHGVIR